MKFSKLVNGNLKSIIIPGGSSKWGWKRMADCLDNLVGKRFWTTKGVFRKIVNCGEYLSTNGRRQNGRVRESYGLFQRKYGYEDKSNLRAPRGPAAGVHTDNSFKRNWRVAVILVRFRASLSWRAIEHGLDRELKIHHDVNPFFFF